MSDELNPTESLSEEQPRLPGMPVPPGAEWREHTAERWKRDDPESYAFAVEQVNNGLLNQSELMRLVEAQRKERGLTHGVSRNSINAMIRREFTAEKLASIDAMNAAIARSVGIDKTTELIDKAKRAQDVGAVALATKQMHDITQVLNDKPTSIEEHRHVVDVGGFIERIRNLQGGGAVPVLEAEGQVVTVPVIAGGEEAVVLESEPNVEGTESL